MKEINYKRMHNEELAELLFTEEDRLGRAAADEIIERASEFLPILSDIAMDRALWITDIPEWWAPIHATYLLGAIGGHSVLVPLMSALRWADAYDNEWITEDLPSILGSLGEVSWPLVVQVVKDKSAGWSARSIAMDALGSHSLYRPPVEEEAMTMLGQILKSEKEGYGARRSAAFVLLDFKRSDLKDELTAFAKEENRMQEQHLDYKIAFSVQDVERDLVTPRVGLNFYTRDWMTFYDPIEIKARQERWAKEDIEKRNEYMGQISQLGRKATTIARDEACPCGSGKSYKRCCFKKLH